MFLAIDFEKKQFFLIKVYKLNVIDENCNKICTSLLICSWIQKYNMLSIATVLVTAVFAWVLQIKRLSLAYEQLHIESFDTILHC